LRSDKLAKVHSGNKGEQAIIRRFVAWMYETLSLPPRLGLLFKQLKPD